MSKRIGEQYDAVHAVLRQDRRVSHLVSTWKYLDVLQSVLEALKDFYEVFFVLLGENE